MEKLKEKIRTEGIVRSDKILKVDSFLNHQVDVELTDEMAEEFYQHFKDKGITKILTVEASGIAIAASVARRFQVPFVFAKKTASQNLDKEVYTASVYSYTRKNDYKIRVSKNYIQPGDKVLIVDDFLAQGNALLGMIDIVKQADAEVVGIGIAIEKGFQNGGAMVRRMGYDLLSLAIVESMEGSQIIFRGNEYEI